MNTLGALNQVGIDELTYLAMGEIVDILPTHGTRVGTMTRTQLIDELTELATGPEGNLPWKLMPRYVSCDDLLTLMVDAIDTMIQLGMLTEIGLNQPDGESIIDFVIRPGFSYYYGTDPNGKAAVAARLSEIRRVGTIPRGAVFATTAPGEGYGILQRAVNVRVQSMHDWHISRGRSGQGVHWAPPAIVYPGSGGYWRDVYAVGPMATIMKRTLDAADRQPQVSA
jgi:hypothetical protein